MNRKPFDMDSFMKSSGRAPEGPQKTPAGAPEGPQRGPMRLYKIRLQEGDWRALEAHFEAQGIPVRTGIRAVIKEYMKRQGI